MVTLPGRMLEVLDLECWSGSLAIFARPPEAPTLFFLCGEICVSSRELCGVLWGTRYAWRYASAIRIVRPSANFPQFINPMVTIPFNVPAAQAGRASVG